MMADINNPDNFIDWTRLGAADDTSYNQFLKQLAKRLQEEKTRREHRAGTKGASHARSADERSREPKTLSPEYLASRGLPPDIEQVAHAYGAGPVTVYADTQNTSRPEATLRNVAKAVAAWNAATSVSLFRLVPSREGADIVINANAATNPGSGHGLTQPGGAGGVGTPSASETGTRGQVSTFGDLAASQARVVKHELGHAVGLDHPGPPNAPYDDPNAVMGGGNISWKEAQLVRRYYGASASSVDEQVQARTASSAPDVPTAKTARKETARANTQEADARRHRRKQQI